MWKKQRRILDQLKKRNSAVSFTVSLFCDCEVSLCLIRNHLSRGAVYGHISAAWTNFLWQLWNITFFVSCVANSLLLKSYCWCIYAIAFISVFFLQAVLVDGVEPTSDFGSISKAPIKRGRGSKTVAAKRTTGLSVINIAQEAGSSTAVAGKCCTVTLFLWENTSA